MKSTINDIAIIFFSRNAESECANKKVISNNSKSNLLLTKTLIQHSQKAIHESGFKVFHFHEGNQIGNTFGERLANAFESIYNLGNKHVISVGNDSPEISNVDWQFISNCLRQDQIVLGPSKRGGAYLIAIPHKNFNKEEFQNLPWQSNKLLESLKHLLDHKTMLLSAQRDINSINDIALLQKHLYKQNHLYRLFYFLLFTLKREYLILSDFFSPIQIASHFGLRAPPFK